MKSNSIMAQVEKPKPRPPIITICSDAGVGKTSLGATFPNSLFMRGEDGMEAIRNENMPDALPVIARVDQVWQQLKAVMFEEHNYKTLVIDSVTALERLFIQHVLESDPKRPTSIVRALGGYGAGPKAVASMHQRIRKAAGILNVERGMNIVFLAHADTEMFEPPDQDSYTRYCLRLAKGSMAPYVDDSDLVGFLKLKTFVKGGGDDDERKKAISTGERELICYSTPANISKNRYGITENIDVPFDINPLVDHIPALALQYQEKAKPEKPKPATKNKTKTPAATEEAPQ